MSKISDLIKMMQDDGVEEEEITLTLEEMTKSTAMELFTHLLSLISKDEAELLDAVADDQERVDQLVDEMYQKYEGKTTEQAVDEMNARFIEAFLEGYGA